MSNESYSLDAYSPTDIAHKVETLGVKKARTDTITLLALSVLAGAFVSLGATFFIVTTTGLTLGFGITRMLGGISFCLGLLLIVIGGAELFTGNNLIAMAWVSRRIRFSEVLRNWIIVYAGNVLGSLVTMALVVLSDTAAMSNGAVGETAINLARYKAGLPVIEIFARGILCNALVCLAVWLVMGGRSVTDKILALILPVTAFVAMGFEHCIANWFFLPYGIALAGLGAIPLVSVAQNIVASTLGNIVGGTLLVAGVYWIAYLRSEHVNK